MALKIESLKLGQDVKLAITKRPKNVAGVKTLERLMRMDPGTVRGLRLAHKRRQQGLVVYNRGNRDWTKRVTCGKFVQPVSGQTWTMTFTQALAADLKSLETCIKVEKA